MLFDAILQRVFNLPPEMILRGLLILLGVVGVIASLIVPVFFQVMDNTAGAKARRKAAIPREAQATIDRLSRRILEAHDRETALRKENHELRRLIAAEANFGRNHRADVQAVLAKR